MGMRGETVEFWKHTIGFYVRIVMVEETHRTDGEETDGEVNGADRDV